MVKLRRKELEAAKGKEGTWERERNCWMVVKRLLSFWHRFAKSSIRPNIADSSKLNAPGPTPSFVNLRRHQTPHFLGVD